MAFSLFFTLAMTKTMMQKKNLSHYIYIYIFYKHCNKSKHKLAFCYVNLSSL